MINVGDFQSTVRIENVIFKGVKAKEGVEFDLIVQPHKISGELLVHLVVSSPTGGCYEVDFDRDLPRLVVPDRAVSMRSLLHADFATDLGRAVCAAVSCLVAPVATLTLERCSDMLEMVFDVHSFATRGIVSMEDMEDYLDFLVYENEEIDDEVLDFLGEVEEDSDATPRDVPGSKFAH